MTESWPYTDRLDLEGSPSVEQQERLEDFLTELKHLTQKYKLLIDSYVECDERPAIRDLNTGTVIGLHLAYFVKPDDEDKILGYDLMGGSIIDGTWPVETEDGLVEMRLLTGRERMRRVFPQS